MKIYNTQYKRRPKRYRLPEKGVHIWKADLKSPLINVVDIMTLLSPDERNRADRFYFQRHKRRYVVCRGLLRVLLSRYLGADPKQIRFAYRKNGKPILDYSIHPVNLFFNVSHSKELALLVFAKCPLVGIDVEYIKYDFRAEELAKRFYHKSENDFLSKLALNRRKKEFYNFWTCKEAYLKATGEGLAGLEKVEIQSRKKKQIILHQINGRSKFLTGWLLQQLEADQDFSAALALKGQHFNIRYRKIPITPPLFN